MKALINVTYQGRSANYVTPMDPGVNDDTIRRVCEEAARAGEIPELPRNLPNNAFEGFIVDRFQADTARFVVRPKVPFG